MPTESSNILPSSDGLDLGSPSQRWDANLRNVTITGNLTVSGSQTNHGIPQFNVLDYGADNTIGYYTNCSSANGSKNLGTVFTNGRVPRPGDTVVVGGIGAAGADLTTTVVSYNASTHTLVMKDAASASLNPCGATWGADSTSAIQSTINAAVAAGGGIIFFPNGQYQVSTVTVPATSGNNTGRITFYGMGRETTRLIGIGADQTAIISLVGPAGSSGAHSTTVQGIGFDSFDSGRKRSTGVYIGGGIGHEVKDCRFGGVFNGILASGTWLSRWEFNYFYGPSDSGIKYDSSSGTAVISCWASFNEFGLVGKYCIENVSAGGGGSNTNRYLFNDFEGTVKQGALYLKLETRPYVEGNRLEPDSIVTDGSWRALTLDTIQGGTFIGNDFSGHTNADYGIELIGNSSDNVFINNLYAPGTVSAVLVNSGVGVNFWYQVKSKAWFTGTNVFQQQFYDGIDGVVNNSSVKIFERGDEPSNSPTRGVVGLVVSGCSLDWGGTAPATKTWTRGDRRFNTVPSELGTAGSKYVVTGWICTVGGTPGTWLEMRTLTGN